ncbi:Transcription antitermination protein NusB [subsurface metagenome]
MKKKSDPRHLARKKVITCLFEWGFQKRERREKGHEKLINGVIDNIKKIDKIIEKAAPAWPIEQITRVDLAILRLAIFELMFGKTAPYKVIIDEAVELAKEFGGETSPGFVNGVLGTVVKEIKLVNQ